MTVTSRTNRAPHCSDALGVLGIEGRAGPPAGPARPAGPPGARRARPPAAEELGGVAAPDDGIDDLAPVGVLEVILQPLCRRAQERLGSIFCQFFRAERLFEGAGFAAGALLELLDAHRRELHLQRGPRGRGLPLHCPGRKPRVWPLSALCPTRTTTRARR